MTQQSTIITDEEQEGITTPQDIEGHSDVEVFALSACTVIPVVNLGGIVNSVKRLIQGEGEWGGEGDLRDI